MPPARFRNSNDPPLAVHIRLVAILFTAANSLVITGCDRQPPDGMVEVGEAPFTVRMPGTPQRSTQESTGRIGFVRTVLYGSDFGTHIYALAIMSLPPEKVAELGAEKTLELVHDEMKSVSQDKPLNSRRLEVGGRPAIDFEFEGKRRQSNADEMFAVHGWGRLVIDKNMVVILKFVGRAENVSSQQATAYFDTLKIAAD